MDFLVPKATPNLVQPFKGHWLKEVPHQGAVCVCVCDVGVCGRVVHVYKHAVACIHVYPCRSQSRTPDIFLYCSPLYCVETTLSGSVTQKLVQGVSPKITCLCTSVLGYRHTKACTAFPTDPGIQIQVLTFGEEVSSPTERSPSPLRKHCCVGLVTSCLQESLGGLFFESILLIHSQSEKGTALYNEWI